MATSSDVLKRVGRATCVVGLHEEDVAMLFAQFSRNTKTLRESVDALMECGDLRPLVDAIVNFDDVLVGRPG